MKRLSLKITILLLLVFIGFNFSDPYFRDKKFFKKTVNTLDENDSIGIFILGSSRAHSSYDPCIFELELGVKTFNLGAPAQKFEATSAAIAHALKSHKPTIAIVDIFALSIGKYYTEKNKNDQLQTLNQIPFSFYKSKKFYEVFGFEGFINGISPTIRNHSAWNEVFFEDFSDDYKIINGVDYYNGFRAYNKSIGDEMWKSFLEKQQGQNEYNRSIELSEKEKRKIDEIVKILRDKGCTPIFVNAPTYVMDYNARNRKYSRKIGDYLNEKDLIYLDLNHWKDSLGLSKYYFSDPNHLNPKGAKITSESLVNYIKRHFNLPSHNLPSQYLEHNRYYHLKNNL